ncbi:hypothetical protein V8E53_011696 [Lactarius tabidus]
MFPPSQCKKLGPRHAQRHLLLFRLTAATTSAEQGTNETVHGVRPHITVPTWCAQVRRCSRTTTLNTLELVCRQRASSGRGKIGLERTDTRAAEWV